MRALFSPNGDVLFVGGERGASYLYRIHVDGSGLQKVVPGTVMYLYGVSPDGKWMGVWAGNSVYIQPVDGGAAVTVCTRCGTAGEENRGVTPPMVSWSADQKFLYLHFPMPARRTYAIPLKAGQAFPSLPASGLAAQEDALKLPGARLIAEPRAHGGANPNTYAFPRVTTQRNIYRVPLP